jgi:hypothetical protein
MKTYLITIRLTVPSRADDQLQTPTRIEEEVTSWLEDLGAEIQSVQILEEK